jgi:hypothetical protein
MRGGRFVLSARLKVAASPDHLQDVVVSCPLSFTSGHGNSRVVLRHFSYPFATCRWEVPSLRHLQFVCGSVRVQAADTTLERSFVGYIPVRR